jgi:hypothetical protein
MKNKEFAPFSYGWVTAAASAAPRVAHCIKLALGRGGTVLYRWMPCLNGNSSTDSDSDLDGVIPLPKAAPHPPSQWRPGNTEPAQLAAVAPPSKG